MKKALIFLCFYSTVQAQQSWNIDLLYNWNDTTIIENWSWGTAARYNEVWGLKQNGREYAVIGSTIGTHIFDVTDPINTVEVDFVPGVYQNTAVVHRDYHDYNGYLYMICGQGNSTLQIADLSYLPDSVQIIYSSDSLIRTAHNIFIDTMSAMLYAVDVRIYQNFSLVLKDLKVLSLSNPINPTLVFEFNYTDWFHDIFVRNDTGFVNNIDNGFSIFDFSDTTSPQLIGSLNFYPQQGVNHSGWLNEDGNIYVFTDETHGADIKICDVSDLGNITILSLTNSGIDDSSIAHNIMIRDNFLYVAYFHDGLYIYDISDPSNPVITGYYDTYLPNEHLTWRGAWGVYSSLPSGRILVSDMQTGLYVFDVSEATVSSEKIVKHNLEISISPNPFNNYTTLSFDNSKFKNYTMEIYNTRGRLVRTITGITSNKVDIKKGDLSSGLYFIHLWTVSQQRLVSKISIE